MTNYLILAGIVIAVFVIFSILRGATANDAVDEGGSGKEKAKYQYMRKQFFLSRAEHECYDALVSAVGGEYRIFAQVHLPTLLEHKVIGQKWPGAFRHIDEKSVDFVLCDKAYLSPILAIELDDKTHERPARQDRDREVERIFKEADIPLLRLKNYGRFDPADLSLKIKEALVSAPKR